MWWRKKKPTKREKEIAMRVQDPNWKPDPCSDYSEPETDWVLSLRQCHWVQDRPDLNDRFRCKLAQVLCLKDEGHRGEHESAYPPNQHTIFNFGWYELTEFRRSSFMPRHTWNGCKRVDCYK